MALAGGRGAGSLLALSIGTRTAVSGAFVDRAPDGLEFGLDEGDSGGLSRKDAFVEFLLVLSEERL